MNARQQRRQDLRWLEGLVHEELAHPHRDTLLGVRRQGSGWLLFRRERGCEHTLQEFSHAHDAIAYLKRWRKG